MSAICGLCGEPMPDGEEAFAYHGFSGPCPVTSQQHDNAGDVSVSAKLAHALRLDAIGHAPRRAERLRRAADEIERLTVEVHRLGALVPANAIAWQERAILAEQESARAWREADAIAVERDALAAHNAVLCEALRQIIEIADTSPFTSVGHVIEHSVPDARAALAACEVKKP